MIEHKPCVNPTPWRIIFLGLFVKGIYFQKKVQSEPNISHDDYYPYIESHLLRKSLMPHPSKEGPIWVYYWQIWSGKWKPRLRHNCGGEVQVFTKEPKNEDTLPCHFFDNPTEFIDWYLKEHHGETPN